MTIDFDGQVVNVLVDVPPDVYELVFLCTRSTASTINISAASGILVVSKHII